MALDHRNVPRSLSISPPNPDLASAGDNRILIGPFSTSGKHLRNPIPCMIPERGKSALPWVRASLLCSLLAGIRSTVAEPKIKTPYEPVPELSDPQPNHSFAPSRPIVTIPAPSAGTHLVALNPTPSGRLSNRSALAGCPSSHRPPTVRIRAYLTSFDVCNASSNAHGPAGVSLAR